MDASGLDERGIGEVDVGHDDRTTLKSGLYFSLSKLSLLQTTSPPYLLYIQYALTLLSKLSISKSILSYEEIFQN